jgi:hypothetical protein
MSGGDSSVAMNDLQAKCNALEQALATLQTSFDAVQAECDSETEQRMELALQLQQAVKKKKKKKKIEKKKKKKKKIHFQLTCFSFSSFPL